jgi:type I restriction-modification system DNA methylase subunit
MKPDYAFFPDQETMEEAYSHKRGAEDFYKKAVAVGDAKAWNVLLDKSRQGKARREMTNPSFQIDVYLRATPAKWAILTNGRMWRLYHEDTSVKMDCYYEVNLPELINRIGESGDITLFKYFYLFFRLEAFPQVPLGSSFLDRVREESAAYAQKIGNDLQENVYKAMKVLAVGFYAEQSNSLSLAPEDIRDVQDNSMRLLYRLLFIFYAESRKLLNTDNKHYTEMSLRRLKEEISGKMDQGETILAVRSTYWEGLKDLFRLINDGSEAFGYPKEEFYIPAYNGGLFDPAKNSFLAQKKIGNSYLAQALDLLARSPGEGKMAFVDYSSLEIRHLGSIYEGILEYKLHLASEPMVAIKEKGKEIWLPAGNAGKKITDRVEAGSLYLVTDKGERKATGSFYTPEYIVKYIVKNTLSPLIDPMMEEAMWSEELRKDLLKKLLSLKVLDPAMGSGHFLVEATDYIAREIIHAREIARHEDLDSDEVAENDIHWARREVVRNCIYGVDLNPMAVELAKLSLWLTTVAANKPLSFLDHHLRCGNSLIGAKLDKLATLPGGEKEQTPLWSYVLKSHTAGLLKRYSLMAALPDDNLQMVKWKEDQFRQIKESELSRRLYELSNVWLSTFFGNIVKDDDYYELQNHLSPEKFPDWAGQRAAEWFTRAQALAGEKRFFHWELEFPEAFQGEGRGFDVVIGNPPWINLFGLSGDDRNYFRQLYQSARGKYDIYVVFVERAVPLSSFEFGMIIPNRFIRSQYGQSLRKVMLNSRISWNLIEFASNDVFKGATTYPCIVIGHPSTIKSDVKAAKVEMKTPKIGDISASQFVTISNEDFQNGKISSSNGDSINRDNIIIPLSNLTQQIGQGIYTGAKEIFVSQNDSIVENELLKPIVDGADLEPYTYPRPQKYLIYPYKINGVNLELIDLQLYPKALEYLSAFKSELIKRRFWGETIASAGKEFYEIWNPSPFIFAPKIMYAEIASKPTFTMDLDGKLACLKTCYCIVLKDDAKVSMYFLLSLLNSKFLFYSLIQQSPTMRGGKHYRFLTQYVERLPIRRISFTTPAPERARLGTELQQLYAGGKFTEILALVEACLPKDGAGNFIADQEKSDVVHDLLAFLAERMLEMNKQKQQEIRGFIGWLEGYLGAKVEDLTPKTRLQSYYEHDYESILAVLKKNRKKLAIDPARREPAEAMRAEFDGSMGKLLPLRERIRQTDELIDAVVYRLYALTQEEIGIVEGKTG